MTFRSGPERRVAELLLQADIPFSYEQDRLPYVLRRTYVPDFRVGDTFFEVKGYWRPADRAKLKAVRLANPHIRLVVLFQEPHRRISKASKTTYAQWADRWGIEWIPLPTHIDQITRCLGTVSLPSIKPAPGVRVQMALPIEQTAPSSASSARRAAGQTAGPRKRRPTRPSP